ncbi:phage tail tube protein [Paenibacillus vietnamensis]|uniref:phage tail tube protein n=1 Tax=Paenibacillus vietnamensis TaxID=2590547 RepID=UPI001CD1679E|nr:phage tail tube protein [Paenibacillus vietnamensis]
MAQRSVGTVLQIGANSVAGLTSIGGLELSAETIDVTTLASNGGYREFIGGFKDGGEVSVSGFFEPGDTNGQMAMYTAFQAGTTDAYSIIFPAGLGATWTFNGVVTGFSTSVDLEEAVTFEATIKVSGAPSLGITASGGLTALSLTATGGTLSPAFSGTNYSYSFGGVSAATATITATAASHTLKLYVDGVYTQDLTSGSASAAITLTLNKGRKLTIIAYETGKAAKVYEVVVIKTT